MKLLILHELYYIYLSKHTKNYQDLYMTTPKKSKQILSYIILIPYQYHSLIIQLK